jgi:hypothetical protein
MERRGLRFVRYADDCQLFTKSDYAAARVMKNTTKYLEGKLKLYQSMYLLTGISG